MTADRAERNLERNLAALRRVQPGLAVRLELPVASEHVDLGPPARYLHHKAWVPLEAGAAPLPELARASEVLVLGVGTGALLERVLASVPAARVTAWDRDPWLLRVALSRLDVAERIANGGLALEELDHQMARLAPALLVAVNYTNGLAELAARHGARLVAWEIDPTTSPPTLDASVPGAADAGVFTWRERDVAAFRDAGFRRAAHLPIGADVDLRRPLALDADDAERYGAPVSYVGASLMQNAAAFQELFLQRWERTGFPRAAGEALMQEMLAEQRRDPTRFVIPALLEARTPDLRAAARAAGEDDPALLLGELAAAEKRLTYVANLGRLGVHAWGDAGWRSLERHGVRYRGPAGHALELTRIYNATRVNVDVGRLYQSDIVTLRTFDVLACGAFALVEHTAELEELFDVGREVVSYRTLPELVEKAAHYVDHPDETAAIARRGLAAVRERHTVDLRLARMLAVHGTA
jgi:spore maturation protein CgeB